MSEMIKCSRCGAAVPLANGHSCSEPHKISDRRIGGYREWQMLEAENAGLREALRAIAEGEEEHIEGVCEMGRLPYCNCVARFAKKALEGE